MPALSLYELARQRLIKNIDLLNDIGDIPYSFLAPVLRHIQNPSQLLELEENCPQIVGETGEIWLKFIKRDIPDWEQKSHKPRDPKNWPRVYKKLKKESEQEKLQQQEALKEQMRALQQSRDVNKTLIVNSSQGYGRRPGGFNFSRGSGGWGNPAAPSKTGKAVFDKLRRGIFDQKQERPKASRMSNSLLAERKATIKQAPARLVRLQENAGPSTIVLSKEASDSVSAAERRSSLPSLKQPQIKTRPVAQQNSSSAPSAQGAPRPSLPIGRQFTAPKLQAQQSNAAQAPKRRREESNLFHEPKRRRAQG